MCKLTTSLSFESLQDNHLFGCDDVFKSLEVSNKVVLFCSQDVLSVLKPLLIWLQAFFFLHTSPKSTNHLTTSSHHQLRYYREKSQQGKERESCSSTYRDGNMIINNVFKYVAVGVTCSLLMYLCALSLLRRKRNTTNSAAARFISLSRAASPMISLHSA